MIHLRVFEEFDLESSLNQFVKWLHDKDFDLYDGLEDIKNYFLEVTSGEFSVEEKSAKIAAYIDDNWGLYDGYDEVNNYLERLFFEKINESLPHKKSIDQLKKIRKMMKGIDIGDRVSDLNKQGSNIIYSRNPIDSGIESYEDYEKHNKKFIPSWNLKGKLSPFNENVDEDRERYQTFKDVVKECFLGFEDDGWNWKSLQNGSISQYTYPSFLFSMKGRKHNGQVESSGYIDENSKITWDSQNTVNNEQLVDDFMTAVGRLNGETSLPFRFSLNTRGGDVNIMIYGRV